MTKITLIFVGILTILTFLYAVQTRALCGSEINRIDRFLNYVEIREVK